jgi:hypothetical protein
MSTNQEDDLTEAERAERQAFVDYLLRNMEEAESFEAAQAPAAAAAPKAKRRKRSAPRSGLTRREALGALYIVTQSDFVADARTGEIFHAPTYVPKLQMEYLDARARARRKGKPPPREPREYTGALPSDPEYPFCVRECLVDATGGRVAFHPCDRDGRLIRLAKADASESAPGGDDHVTR